MEKLSQMKSTVNSLKNSMHSILSDLKENYGVIGIKAEFEAEGATFEEIKILKDLIFNTGLDLTLKIGGCEAITDIKEAKKLGANTITAPMTETPYAMKKFVNAIHSVYTEKEAEKVKLLINVETVTGYNNFNDILFSENFKYLDGVVLGRGDMTGSIGLTRKDVNSEQILNIALSMSEKMKSTDKSFYVGGGISAESLPFLKKLPYITGFQTRKVVFNSDFLNNSQAEKGILKAIDFEIMWLKYKQELSLATKQDEARINMLSKYNGLIEVLNGKFA